MFKHFKNIDTAFRYIRAFSLLFLLANALVVCFSLYQSKQLVETAQNRVVVLYNGSVVQAVVSQRKANLPVELKDHIQNFHHYFFELSPDEKAIKENMLKALFLADASAARQYDNLKESGFYNNLIAASVVQTLQTDSIQLDTDHYPYAFTYYGHQRLERSSNTSSRQLITSGRVRNLSERTPDNPHGFLIEDWQVLQNQALSSH